MTEISERLSRWAASRHQTTADVEARYAVRSAEPVNRVPLTTNQHILHLLLTVFTGGLWGIVWIIRAGQGNRR